MQNVLDGWSEPYDLLASFKPPCITSVGQFDVYADGSTYYPLLSEAVSIASARGLDTGALFFAMLAAASATIPNSIRLQVDPEHHPDWFESACIWALLICEPSTKKSLYHRLATEPLEAHDDRLERETILAQEAFFSTPPKSRSGTRPPDRRLLIDDVTPAQLRVLLKDNSDRLLLSSEESANLIGLHPGNRSIYNKAYNGEPQRADRKTTESTKIRGAYISMLLSTHPDIMRSAANEAEHDGYWQRFVPIQISPRAEIFDKKCEDQICNYGVIIDLLLGIKSNSEYMVERFRPDQEKGNTLRFCNDAQFAFGLYKYEIMELAKIGVFQSSLGAHIGKMDRLVCRIAMIMHILKHAPPENNRGKSIPAEIKFEELKISFEIVRYYVIPHLYSFNTNYFNLYTNSEVKDGALEILSKNSNRFYASQLKRPKDYNVAIKGLVAAGWIRPVQINSRLYEVNPRVFSNIGKTHRDLIALQMQRPELISRITLSGNGT
ncbi:DUF3987 domain-containing protein [Bosea thiooxidans]